MAITKIIADSITSGAIANTPAFEAYLNTEQNLLNNTITIVSIDTEVYDEGGCFNATGSTATLNGISVPARTFLPNVAGKYFVYAAVQADDGIVSNLDAMDVFFYNEGDAIISQQRIRWSNNQIRQGYVSLQAVINLNGSSNSVKLKTRVATADGTGPLIEAYPSWRRATYFGAYKIIT